MAHDHHHDPHPGHTHALAAGHGLRWVLFLTLVYACVEVYAGLRAGSLALLGDAGHMFLDALVLAMAMVAAWIARKPPSARHSYGLARIEVIAALVNGLLMLVVVLAIVIEAVERLQQARPVQGGMVLGVAMVGLIINVAAALILSRGGKNLNMRAALLHVIGDLLGSVAALMAGAVIYVTGWTPIDPILSLVICALILYSTQRLLRDAMHVLMEGVPSDVDLNVVGHNLARVAEVVAVHDLHIWTLASGVPALSAHVVLRDLSHWLQVLAAMRTLLRQDYGIEHVTLQPELSPPSDGKIHHINLV